MSKFYNSSNEWMGVTENYAPGSCIDPSVMLSINDPDNFLSYNKNSMMNTISQPSMKVQKVGVFANTTQNTTKDSQCHVNLFPSGSYNPTCYAVDRQNPNLNFNNNSCTYYKGRCYTNNPESQCKSNNECNMSWTGECVNKTGKSSLYCRHAGFLGTCICTKDKQWNYS